MPMRPALPITLSMMDGESAPLLMKTPSAPIDRAVVPSAPTPIRLPSTIALSLASPSIWTPAEPAVITLPAPAADPPTATLVTPFSVRIPSKEMGPEGSIAGDIGADVVALDGQAVDAIGAVGHDAVGSAGNEWLRSAAVVPPMVMFAPASIQMMAPPPVPVAAVPAALVPKWLPAKEVPGSTANLEGVVLVGGEGEAAKGDNLQRRCRSGNRRDWGRPSRRRRSRKPGVDVHPG